MTKPTIILIHGFRGTHHGLQLIADELRDKFTTVVPDLPGFGEGEHLDSYDIGSYVEWLHGLISKYNQPFLLGHSFGSIVCSAYAAKYPSTIKKLILVNPIGAPALQGPKKILTKLAVFYYWTGRKLPESVAKKWLSSKAVVQIMSSTMAKTRDRQLRKYIHAQHHQHFSTFHTAESLSQSFMTSINHSVRDFASSIKVETLLIAGDKDDITPLNKQKELVQLFPDAKLEVIKKVGHLTHYETPDQIAKLVKEFTS